MAKPESGTRYLRDRQEKLLAFAVAAILILGGWFLTVDELGVSLSCKHTGSLSALHRWKALFVLIGGLSIIASALFAQWRVWCPFKTRRWRCWFKFPGVVPPLLGFIGMHFLCLFALAIVLYVSGVFSYVPSFVPWLPSFAAPCPARQPRKVADINRDGTVDALDLLTVLEQWGPVPPPAERSAE